MDFLELVKSRYSVRSYQSRPVEQEKLDRVLEAARLAPTGSNEQPWKFVVVRDAEIGLTPDRVMHCDIPGDPVDLSIVMDHVTLAAAAEGLGTCWIGAFHQDKVREVLGIPDRAKVVEVMALGYPADSLRPKHRKPVEELVCYDRWS